MVDSDLENYQVYLERGRYRRRFGESPALGTIFKSRSALARVRIKRIKPRSGWKLPSSPRRDQGADAARKILEKELKTAPARSRSRRGLILLELRAGRIDKAIELLRQSLQDFP